MTDGLGRDMWEYFLFPEHFALVFLEMTIIAFVQADNSTVLQIPN